MYPEVSNIIDILLNKIATYLFKMQETIGDIARNESALQAIVEEVLLMIMVLFPRTQDLDHQYQTTHYLLTYRKSQVWNDIDNKIYLMDFHRSDQ